jgi:hypothetical protein
MIFPVTFGQMKFTHIQKPLCRLFLGLLLLITLGISISFSQEKKDGTDLCKLKNKMLEAEVLKLEEMVKKQHEENIELKNRIQNSDPKIIKTFEDEYKKAKSSLPRLLETAIQLEGSKDYYESSEIYSVISTYFPSTYEAYEANKRLPNILSKVKKK